MNTEQNKAIVVRFNKEFIEQNNENSFNELLSDNVVNHSAPAGMPNGKESFHFFLNNILRAGFPNLTVNILEQVAEGDLVTTRKKIQGRHTGNIFGIAPSNQEVEINIIEIVRIQNGKYAEHWGQSNFDEILKQVSAA